MGLWRLGALALAASGCSDSLDTALEGRACTAKLECVSGYECSRGICVRADKASREDDVEISDGATPDADLQDAGGPVTTGSGTCRPEQRCGGRCVETARDVSNCGGCGTKCPDADHGSASCRSGRCRIVCDTGWTECDGTCVQLASSPTHCGSCGRVCPAPPQDGVGICVDAECQMRCNVGSIECGGECVNPQIDPKNCGGCGAVCPDNQQCADTLCVPMCPAGTHDCERSCADLQTDPQNCGGCGNVCSATAPMVGTCTAGMCGTRCADGLMDCGGTCIDTQNDAANCGMCGKVCPDTNRGNPLCAAGACSATCDMGFALCDGLCINASAVESARQAGLGELTPCAAYAALQNLSTRRVCQQFNLSTCDGACVNVALNSEHCGRCDRACEPDQNCVGGFCF